MSHIRYRPSSPREQEWMTQVRIPGTNEFISAAKWFGKLPRRKFLPGTVVLYNGRVLVIEACYRLVNDHIDNLGAEWMYICSDFGSNTIASNIKAANKQEQLVVTDKKNVKQRIFLHLFSSHDEAERYFAWLMPNNCASRNLSTDDISRFSQIFRS